MSALTSLLTVIRDGEFRAEDHSDATVQRAIREGLIEGYPFQITTQGEAETHDDEYDAHRDHAKPGSRGDK